MKLVFVNNYYYLRGGAERVFFEEAELLASRGHEVVPFSRRHEENIVSPDEKYFASDLKYYDVSIPKKISASIKLIYSYECKRKITDVLRSFSPDIVHGHNIYGRMTTSIIDAAKKNRVPVVMTLHDFKLICPSYLMLSKGMVCDRCMGRKYYYCLTTKCHKNSLMPSLVYTLESYFNSIFRKYDNVKYFISPSKFLLKKHVEAGIEAGKLVHIPNFINSDNYVPDYSSGKYVLFAGRLSMEKGVMILLKAMRNVNMPLKIVGDGPMRIIYETYAKENNLRYVRFEGYRSGQELAALYKNASFVIVPSECYENAPMTVLEAFAYGKPVIASNIGGMSEMVIDNETGFLFEPGDHELLKEKIQYLADRPSLAASMGKKARKKIEEEYDSERHYERLMKLYGKACSE